VKTDLVGFGKKISLIYVTHKVFETVASACDKQHVIKVLIHFPQKEVKIATAA
jgi:hypothetical protein